MARLELAVECGEKFRVSHFFVRDELSTPFEIWLQVVTENAQINSADLVDARAAFLLDDERAETSVLGPQIWTGICTQFRLLNAEPTGISYYLLRIEPELVRLRYRRNCRTFVDASAKDICETIVTADWGMSAGTQITAAADAFVSAQPFTLQYHESDLAFVSRLLEDAAVSYRFESPASLADAWPVTEGTMLVIDDIPKRAAGRPAIAAVDPDESSWIDYVAKVQLDHNLRTHDATVVDYNFRRPANLGSDEHKSKHTAAKTLNKNYSNYWYRIGATSDTRHESAQARSKAASRWADASCADVRVLRCETNAYDLLPGTTFTIENHPQLEDGDTLLVTQLTLEGEASKQWQGAFTAVFDNEPYAPPRITPRPSIYGVQSATVVKTDELGRVAVTFPWDADAAEVAWLRMSHPYASTAHGMHALPLEGDEVLVSFLQGDLDQPLVVGSLYNETHKPAYDPGTHATRSSWRDASSNELTMEAKSGSEVVHLAATKDMNMVADGSLFSWVGTDHEEEVVGDQKTLVGGALSLTVKGDDSRKISGTASLDAGDGHVKFGTSYGVDAGTTVHLKAGTNAVIEAGVTLTLKAGSNFVEISPAGVTIKGTMVMINCPGGPPGSGSGSSPVAPTEPGGKPELPS